MTAGKLQQVAELITRRAQRQGYILPREVREECAGADFPQDQWKDVIAQAGDALRYRSGRYYYNAPVTERVRAEQAQQIDIQQAIHDIIRQHRENAERVERRRSDRIDFVHAVKVYLEDGRELTLLTRDLSGTGIRLIGTRRLLGQKVRVLVPGGNNKDFWDFQVRILWTCPVGDDLVENGGSFMAVTPPDFPPQE